MNTFRFFVPVWTTLNGPSTQNSEGGGDIWINIIFTMTLNSVCESSILRFGMGCHGHILKIFTSSYGHFCEKCQKL